MINNIHKMLKVIMVKNNYFNNNIGFLLKYRFSLFFSVLPIIKKVL